MGAHSLKLAGGLAPFALLLVMGCGSRQPGPVVPIGTAVSPALDPEAEGQARVALPAGHRAADSLVGAGYGPEGVADWSVAMQAGNCYAFGYAAEPGVGRFSVYLWDPSGRRVATSRNRTTAGAVSYCPLVTGTFKLEGKVTVGAGHFVLVPYQTGGVAVPAGGAMGMAQPVTLPVTAPTQRGATVVAVDIPTAISHEASVAAVGATRLGDFFTGVGDQSDWSAQLTAGTCYWFVGAGEPGKVLGLTLSLWDPRQSPITQARSDGQVATLTYCAKETGAYRFEAKVNAGHGDYKVGVYSK